MIDKAPDEPEFPNEYYEEALLALVTALPPGELISDLDLTERHGLQPQVWLDVALSLIAEGEPVVIEEIEDMQGWQFGFARNLEELECTRARILRQFLLLGAALQGVNGVQSQMVAAETQGFVPSVN
jgi:hypothetical protein